MLSGPTAGINALTFRDVSTAAAGGDFDPNGGTRTCSRSATTAGTAGSPSPTRPTSTAPALRVTGREVIIVGPTGSEVSFDQGRSWQPFDSGSFHTVDCAGGHACWASGALGRVAYRQNP